MELIQKLVRKLFLDDHRLSSQLWLRASKIWTKKLYKFIDYNNYGNVSKVDILKVDASLLFSVVGFRDKICVLVSCTVTSVFVSATLPDVTKVRTVLNVPRFFCKTRREEREK